MLALGTEAAEGWLTVLEAVPQAACVTLGGAQPPGSQSGAGTAGQLDEPSRQPATDSIASAANGHKRLSQDAPAPAAPLYIPPSRLRSWMANMQLSSLAELALTGKELSEGLDKRPGPWLGELLQRLLHAVAAGDIPNDKQLLLQEAKKDGS